MNPVGQNESCLPLCDFSCLPFCDFSLPFGNFLFLIVLREVFFLGILTSTNHGTQGRQSRFRLPETRRDVYEHRPVVSVPCCRSKVVTFRLASL